MGYEADSQGIINRFIRVEGAWDEHLSNTRNFILQSMAGKKTRNVAVYGSGWLLDLPLDEITDRAEHVWLYDVIHPSQVIHKLRRYKNITLVNADVTGNVLTRVYEAVQDFQNKGIRPQIASLCQGSFFPEANPDFSVSLNILSQLGDLVSVYLSKNIPLTTEEKELMTQMLQLSHLELLSRQPSCLISDVQENVYDRFDQLTATKELIKCILPEARHSSSWIWKFDPLGEYHPGMKTFLTVAALEL